MEDLKHLRGPIGPCPERDRQDRMGVTVVDAHGGRRRLLLEVHAKELDELLVSSVVARDFEGVLVLHRGDAGVGIIDEQRADVDPALGSGRAELRQSVDQRMNRND